MIKSRGEPISRSRKLVYAALAIFLFLAIVTGALSLFEKSGALVTNRQDDRVAYLQKDILHRQTIDGREFFVIKDPHPTDPALLESKMPVEKEPGTFRILVTGGSFMMGDPYVDPQPGAPNVGGIPDWLGAILSQMYPSVKFEVINACAGGQNSSRIRQLVKQLLPLQPDLLLVGMGNNEGYVAATPFNEELHQWVLYRALKKAIHPDPDPEDRRLFPPQDTESRRISDNFKKNVEKILSLCGRSDIPVALASLPINLSYYGPNPWMMGPSIPLPENDACLRQGIRSLDNERYEEAISIFKTCGNQFWVTHFIGRAMLGLGRVEQARSFFENSVELYPMGRTRPSFNRFVKEAARADGAIFIDLEKAAGEKARPGQVDPDFFFDNCHLTYQGYYEMAKVIASTLAENPPWPAAQNEPAPIPSMESVIEDKNWSSSLSFRPEPWWTRFSEKKAKDAVGASESE